uniref:Endonuclease n=1 Tax=Photinus pyralis TaxID=7054 RepID=A0A1Y1LCN3_PHOPY
MDMEKATISVNKLEGATNWNVWKFQLRVLLKGQGLFEVVDGTVQKPENVEEKKKWIEKDAKAQSIIVNRLSESAMLHVITCESACEMWKQLLSIYEKRSTVSVHLVQQRFFAFKYGGESMSVHVAKLQEISNELKQLGQEVSEQMLMTKLLMSLPQEYKYFVSAWESVAEDNQKLDELIGRLLMEEDRMKNQEECTTSALAAKSRKKEFRCHHCGKEGHIKKFCKSRNSEGKTTLSCYFCKKPGHKISECRYRMLKDKGCDNGREKSNAFVVSAMNCKSSSGTWLVDSGASEHMCYERDLFVNYRKLTLEKEVVIGDGKKINAVGIGQIQLLAFNGQLWIPTTIYNVLHVPMLTTNLFSVSSATDKGYIMISDSKHMKFMKDNQPRAVANRQGQLYVMMFRMCEFPTEVANVNQTNETLTTWHERLAHQNIPLVKQILNKHGVQYTTENCNKICEACVKGKQHKMPFSRSETKTTEVCELVHMDLCGPMENSSIGGAKYFLLIKDDYSHYRTVYYLKNKYETIEKLEHFLKYAEVDTGKKVKVLRSDNGTEFVNRDVKALLERYSVKHQTTVSYTPEQNGKIEREMRTVVEAARTLLQAKGMEKKFWAEAVNTSVFVINRTGTSTILGKTPYALWHGKDYDIHNLQIFGTRVYAHLPKPKRQKWDAKGEFGIFMGYGEDTKGYRIYFPTRNTLEVKRDVIFVDDVQDDQHPQADEVETEKYEEDEEIRQEEVETDNYEEDEKIQHEEINSNVQEINEGFEVKIVEDKHENPEENKQQAEPNRSKRVVKLPSWMQDYETSFISVQNEPQTYDEAMKRSDRDKWAQAIRDELNVLQENNTWTEVELPDNRRALNSKWVFKTKICENGELQHKARLVAKGFEQVDKNLGELYAPVAKLSTFRVFVTVATKLKLPIYQMDVRSAFLNGEIDEEVYIRLPEGLESNYSVGKLNKSIYGLKKSPKYWNDKFNSVMQDEGFCRSLNDYCLYIRIHDHKKLYILLYVDDLLIFGTDQKEVSELKVILNRNFKIRDLGFISNYLGINVKQHIEKGIVEISQEAYLREVLKRFQMYDCKPMSTPMEKNFKLEMSDKIPNENLVRQCRKLIGCLVYAVCGTRPDLCASLSYLSRYQSCANDELYKALKRVLRYIKATIDLKLVYKCKDLGLLGYVDADWGGDCKDRKSTTGYFFKLCDCTVSWCSKKQPSVALSSTEAEYVALSMAVSEACWLSNLIADFKCGLSNKPIEIFEDNQSAIKIAKNSESHSRLKHVDIRYHFVKDKVAEGLIKLSYIKTEDQAADMFTKPLGKELFCKFRNKVGLSTY